jgi:hypothetical protein
MYFALCKEQQHSQIKGVFVILVQLKLLRVFMPAGLTVFIYFKSGKIPVFDCAVALCPMKNALLAISNST